MRPWAGPARCIERHSFWHDASLLQARGRVVNGHNILLLSASAAFTVVYFETDSDDCQ